MDYYGNQSSDYHTEVNMEAPMPTRRRPKASIWPAFFTALLVSAGTSVAMHIWVLPHLKLGGLQAGPSNESKVPDLLGKSLSEAQGQLTPLGLRLKPVARTAAPKPMGTILSQIPPAGQSLPKGKAVKVVISSGPKRRGAPPKASTPRAPAARPPGQRTADASGKVVVPRVRSRHLSIARRQLKKAGLRVGALKYGADEDVGPLIILRQNPAAGTRVPKGTKVDLVVNRQDL